MLARFAGSDECEQIVELAVFPNVPLEPRGTHVAFDVDLTDPLEDWITFKSHLLQTSLVNTAMVETFRHGKSVKGQQQLCGAVRDAVRNAETKRSLQGQQPDSQCPAFWALSSIDAIQQQVARVNNCYERLSQVNGLLMHIEIYPQPADRLKK